MEFTIHISNYLKVRLFEVLQGGNVEHIIQTPVSPKFFTLDAGGVFDAPDSAEMMLISATEIGKAIGSQYVVAYAPQRPYADSSADELRQVRVVSRRVGLQVRARQKVVLANQPK